MGVRCPRLHPESRRCPERLPATLCSRTAEGLARLAASSASRLASSEGRIYPQPFPSPSNCSPPGRTPPRITPRCSRASPIPPARRGTRLQLHLTPQVRSIFRQCLAKPSPPALWENPAACRCLQGNEEEPFNLFSHLKTQTDSCSLSQEVSALGERAAIRCHLLETIILHYWKREEKVP